MAQHISIRVPWHDDGWKGSVCQAPSINMSCLRLKNIKQNRKDSLEEEICGKCMMEHEEEIPCIGEGGAFMSNKELHKWVIHPYRYRNADTHKHFLETDIVYPPYSLPARPYSWLMLKKIEEKVEKYGINYDSKQEPKLNFNTNWIQEASNHRVIFDSFYQDVIPNQSLCIAYAKQVPFVEDNRRVIIGMGHVKRIIPAKEHNHTEEGKLRSLTWETMICHSIREDHEDGFVIPYQEMMEYAKNNPDFDLTSIAVFAPEESFEEFSYATEHVSHDSVIDVILSCIKAFKIINECLDEDYTNTIEWLNQQLETVWEERGAFPGLGAMLTSFEVKLGIPIAKYMKENVTNENIMEYLDKTMRNPQKFLPKNLADCINPIVQGTWKRLPDERKKLFQLLSRFAITIEQAKVLYEESERRKRDILCTDQEIIENPYILYEQTRLKQENLRFTIEKVDRAIFPVPSIAKKYPLEEPSKLTSDNDKRRIRAVVISVLEKARQNGHTILPANLCINQVKELTLEPACPITSDMIFAIESFMSSEVIKREMKDGNEYYKLVHINQFDQVIEKRVYKRIHADKIVVDANWRRMVDEEIKKKEEKLDFQDDSQKLSEEEELARQEKAEVLKVLAESRLSVLVGDAGTGKTTVLSILCKEPSIKNGGVLLLAPTGKATVVLKEKVNDEEQNFSAQNIAQFLTKSKRFDWNDMRYRLANYEERNLPETVIIDEASMLTEEMFGALLEAISHAKRIIFVGDPNQLPPIGAGRPFVDLVDLLKEGVPKNANPKVGNCYGELQIVRRQQDEKERLDINLARYFTRTSEIEDEDNILATIMKNENKNIEIQTWKTSEELENKLLEVVAKEIGMEEIEDKVTFDQKLGGTMIKNATYFNKNCAEKINEWQILAPVRNMPQGVININRLFHKKYRATQIELAKRRRGHGKCIPIAYGLEDIVYGDKVINVHNVKKSGYPKDGKSEYVANGEIGIACGKCKKELENDYLQVCFSSQKDYIYSYDKKDFNEETGIEMLELAYALTVHKSQGSQFKTVILVLAEPCYILSKEMLYTALTRQENKIVILYNNEPYQLLKYASNEYSDIARRYTDLFAGVWDDNGNHKPQITEINGTFYEERLIHKTVRGELVRSKSEVIIANALYYNHVDYEYEPELILEGHLKRPDFKIVDADTGKEWYWEHCGMMSNAKYAKRWEEKKKFYTKNGIIEGKNLIVTKENNKEGLDSDKIDEIVKRTFML
ncbi:MAG: AAA family ATPase [Clostridia bacterium]|nr:AAA family ATPase [Clostridia bacterium]